MTVRGARGVWDGCYSCGLLKLSSYRELYTNSYESTPERATQN